MRRPLGAALGIAALIAAIFCLPLGQAIDPEQLKPCFERYDGHKLFGASPIHSEWRMNNEEECLPFCIRAASRCASIVYDKQERTCYYFSVNGIEMENIERNPRMVYLQVAERRCVDDMLMVMESEDTQGQRVTVSISPDATDEDRRYILQRYPQTLSKNSKASKITYGKVEAQMNVPTSPPPLPQSADQLTTVSVLTDLTTTTIASVPTITTTAANRRVVESTANQNGIAALDKIYDDAETLYSSADVHPEPSLGALPIASKAVSESPPSTDSPTLSSFVAYETFSPVVSSSLASQTSLGVSADSENNSTLVSHTSQALSSAASKFSHPADPQAFPSAASQAPSSATSVRLVQSSFTMSTAILPAEPVTASKLSKYRWKGDSAGASSQMDTTQPATATPQFVFNALAGLGSAVESMPSFLPVMSGFKAQRRPIPVAIGDTPSETNTDPTDFHISNEVRRHPSASASTPRAEILTTVRPATVRAKTPPAAPPLDESNLNRDSAPAHLERVPLDELGHEIGGGRGPAVAVPRVESLPPTSTESDDVEMASYDNEGDDGCDPSMRNEIWLAVESAKLKSSLRARNMNYLAPSQPKDCMRDCSRGKAGSRRRRCDAFTYLENSRHCVFDTVGREFLSKLAAPAPRPDFSTRAFYRLCFPTNMDRFRGCTEFLAFRNYGLNIPPREFFNGLPAGAEGVTACVELCVLSSDFQCRSALFDENAGVCQLFDEHSLSAPQSFKEHAHAGQLYFENGCLDGGELPQVESLGSNLQRSLASKDLNNNPKRVDFGKGYEGR